jgi:hypothetical protein
VANETQCRPMELVRVSDAAYAEAARVVKVYDGDQTDSPCVEVGGWFVVSASGLSPALLAAHLRGVVAKAIDAAKAKP